MPQYGKSGQHPDFDSLVVEATPRGGLFTTQAAQEYGISRRLLSYYAEQRKIERLARGVYKVVIVPPSRHEEIVSRVIAAGPGAVAAASSALQVWQIGRLSDDRIFVRTSESGLPRYYPRELTVRTVVLKDHPPGAEVIYDGVPVESVDEAIQSTIEHTSFDRDQIRHAVEEAKERGLVAQSFQPHWPAPRCAA